VREVRRLLAAYACSSVAIGLPWPLLLVLMWDRYGGGPYGAWAVGLAGAARMAPYVLFSWAAGSLGDHVRRDRLVRTTLALRLAFLVAAAIAVAGQHTGIAVLAAALAVLSSTPTYPAIGAALPALAGSDRVRATELLVTIEVGAWVVGPALGGLLLTPSLRPWTLVVSVALAALGLGLATGVGLPSPVEQASDAVGGMIREVLACRPAVAALGVAALLNVCVTASGMLLLPLAEQSWGHGDEGFGLATACLGFGALGAPALARLALTFGGMTTTRGLVTIGVAVAAVAATPVPWPALPLLALAGATGVVIESRVTGALQEAVPDHYRAGALGLADSVMVGACLVGSLVAPALASQAGSRPALLLVAVAATLPPLTTRLLPNLRPRTAYDAASDRTAAGPDPRGAPAMGAARVG